jgi:hypothetical protein
MISKSIKCTLCYIAFTIIAIKGFEASAEQNLELLSTYSSGYAHTDFSVDSNYVYLMSYRFFIIDITDPFFPAVVGSCAISGYNLAIDVKDDYAFYTSSNTGLGVIDIADPYHPYVLTTIDTTGTAFDISISGNYAYTANQINMMIINIQDPANPYYVSSYSWPGNNYAWIVKATGSYAYLADLYRGLEIIDISNPLNPLFVGLHDHQTAYTGIDKKNDLLCLSGGSGFEIVDISDHANPYLLSTLALYTGQDMEIAGDYALTCRGSNGFMAIDISDSLSPSLFGNYRTANNYDQAINVVGDYIYYMEESYLRIFHFDPDLRGAITGTVTGLSNPVPGVHIEVDGTNYETFTDSSGTYFLEDLPASELEFIFTHQDFVQRKFWLDIYSNDTTLYNIDLPALPGRIGGRVTDENSAPVSGVHIRRENGSLLDTTDANGKYLSVNLDVGTYDIFFTHEDFYDTAAYGVTVTPGDTTTQDMVMEYLPGDVVGTVNDTAGASIENAAVAINILGLLDSTDISGAFSLDDIPMGYYLLNVSHLTHNDSAFTIHITPGDTSVVSIIMNETYATIKGRTYTDAHVGLRDVVVSIVGTPFIDTVDRWCRFQFDDVPGEIYDIAFHHWQVGDTTIRNYYISNSITYNLEVYFDLGCPFYVAGDANNDGISNGLDVIFNVNYFKFGSPAPPVECLCYPDGYTYPAAEANGDCLLSGMDVTFFINYLKGSNYPPRTCRLCPPDTPQPGVFQNTRKVASE